MIICLYLLIIDRKFKIDAYESHDFLISIAFFQKMLDANYPH